MSASRSPASRLSRDAAEILRLVRLLQGLRVKLISVADGIAREHLSTATTMYRKMDMRFWLEQAEPE